MPSGEQLSYLAFIGMCSLKNLEWQEVLAGVWSATCDVEIHFRQPSYKDGLGNWPGLKCQRSQGDWQSEKL